VPILDSRRSTALNRISAMIERAGPQATRDAKDVVHDVRLAARARRETKVNEHARNRAGCENPRQQIL